MTSVKTPPCPYADHEPSERQEIWPTEVKVLFDRHEVMGEGYQCDQCGGVFFKVQSFNQKSEKEKDTVSYATYLRILKEVKSLKQKLKER